MISFLLIALLLWFFWQPLLLIGIGFFTLIGGLFAWHRWKCRPKTIRSNPE